ESTTCLLKPLCRESLLVETIFGQWLVDRSDCRAAEDHPGPQLPVACPANALVEPANLHEARAPDRRVPEHEVALQDGLPLVLSLERMRVVVEPSEYLPAQRKPGIGCDHVDVRARCDKAAERFEALWLEQVVGSDETNVVTGCSLHAGVHRGSRASVFPAQEFPLCPERLNGRLDLVGRAVIDDDHLQRRASLIEHRLDRVSD